MLTKRNRGQNTGWQGFIRVDGTTYNWMGAAPGPSPVTQTSFKYTATSSIFTFDVSGKVTMTLTFLSPIYPNDLVQQSLQFSYVTVDVESSSPGQQHSVQVYMDVSGGKFGSVFAIMGNVGLTASRIGKR